MNREGARTAIQSQWTFRPNSGLTEALTGTEIPTRTTAHTMDTGQPRLSEPIPLITLWSARVLFSCLERAGFFIDAPCYRVSIVPLGCSAWEILALVLFSERRVDTLI